MMSLSGRRAINQKENPSGLSGSKGYHICSTSASIIMCQQKEELEVLELNAQPDHVQLIMSITPKCAV